MRKKIKILQKYERLEKLLSENLNFSRSSIEQKFKSGDLLIFVNSKKIPKLSFSVSKKDELEVELIERKNNFKFEILFENEDFFAIEKPTGIPSTSENLGKISIANLISEKFPDQEKNFSFEENFGLVHRLDKETSGVLLISKTKKFYEILKKLFKERKIQKTYQAISNGDYSGKDEGTIKSFLNKRNGIVFISEKEKYGVFAETKFKIIKKEDQFFFIEIFPCTGRTHQIRVHLSSIGLPIIGDKIYNKFSKNSGGEKLENKKSNLTLKDSRFLWNDDLDDRMMLHAKKIKFLEFEIESKISLF
ncbi:MAG: RluA family pseudouridine synthase [Patescibacteria group bacterium]